MNPYESPQTHKDSELQTAVINTDSQQMISTTRPDRFDRCCRTCYWTTLALGCSILVLFPVWRGKGSSNGLRGVTAHTNQAPLWAPPKTVVGPSSVRLPWQSVQSRGTVEIELFAEATLLAALVAGCGTVLRMAYGLAFRPPDRFVWLAWSMAGGLLLTGSVVLFTLLITLGAMLDDYESWVIAIMLVGAPLGWWYGHASWRSAPSALDDTEHLGDHAPSGIDSDRQRSEIVLQEDQTARAGWNGPAAAPITGSPSSPAASPIPASVPPLPIPRSSPSRANALWQFTLGLILGLALWSVACMIANAWFRGPIVGHNEFAFPRYARNQLPINIGIGITVGLAGWGIGLAARRRLNTRSLSAGIIVSSTLLGILTCFWK